MSQLTNCCCLTSTINPRYQPNIQGVFFRCKRWAVGLLTRSVEQVSENCFKVSDRLLWWQHFFPQSLLQGIDNVIRRLDANVCLQQQRLNLHYGVLIQRALTDNRLELVN